MTTLCLGASICGSCRVGIEWNSLGIRYRDCVGALWLTKLPMHSGVSERAGGQYHAESCIVREL